MTDFWNNIQTAKFDNEASVETRLVIPLLHALGYDNNDIAPKHKVIFQEGRKGRPHEADFVVFYGSTHNKNTSLIAIEAKTPNESFTDAKMQGESYAANIKTPFLLLTDGIMLEIWQLQSTQECECLVKEEVKNLCAIRGKIEACLSKKAAYTYCRSLDTKNALTMAEDFHHYEVAELNRTTDYQHVIERTLSNQNDKTSHLSGDLISNFQNGAIILAPSGYGKTTLSYSLLRDAIEMRQSGITEKLPFDVPLPDLSETETSFLKFINRRITSHHPGVTETYLIDLLREKGVVLLCDGFERLAADKQEKIRAEFKNLMRDFPKSQVFVFSRSIVTLDLNLPTLELQLLTIEQQNKLIESFKATKYSSYYFQYLIPATLRKLCTHPLLLTRILKYWQQHEEFPKKIQDLFESWLKILLHSNSSVNSIYREAAVSLLAKATIKTPINKMKAIGLIRENDFPDTTFDELLHCGAIQISGSVVEVQHEALADYLRVLDMVSNEEDVLRQLLSEVTLERDSFFSILLMALLPSRGLQNILWKRLSHSDIHLYLKSLRYRADVSEEMLKALPKDIETQYLEDLIEGIEFPLIGFFPQLQDIVTKQMIGIKNNEIAITGWVNPNHLQIGFAFHPIETSESKINVGSSSPYPKRYGVNLDLSEYRLDSGRLLGAKHLKENILLAIKERTLKGGQIWAEERLLSRIQLLAKEYNFPINVMSSLDDLEQSLKPDAEKIVISGYHAKSPKFYIQDLLEDIAFLKKHEKSSLDFWWLSLGWENSYTTNDGVIQKVFDEYYRRVQLAYKEIIEHSFQSIAHKFGFYNALPVRWDLAIVKNEYRSSLYERWLPIASWQNIGADTEFTDSVPDRFQTSAFFEQFEALDKLGRKSSHTHVWENGGIMPSFDGDNLTGNFNGETFVIPTVCKIIADEIERLFSDLPSHD